MSRTVLRMSDGEHTAVKKGASCDIVVKFLDMSGTALVASKIDVLTCSHYVASTGTAINQRAPSGSKHNILNENGGTLVDTTEGEAELTLEFDPADTVIEDASDEIGPGQYETHFVLISWEWVDESGDRRYGCEEFEIYIEERTTPVLAA